MELNLKTLALSLSLTALGGLAAASCASTQAAMPAGGAAMKGGDHKCGEGKCGANMKGGEHKCGEGKCGEDMKKADAQKGVEKSCGKGSCG